MNARITVACVVAWVGACVGAAEARAGERYAVVVGNNVGAQGEPTLKYAESDARRMADALRTVAEFRPENVVVLNGATGAELMRVLLTVNDRLRDDPDAVLIVYYSGHASSEALHTGKDTVPLGQLEQAVRGSSARFRVLIVDACRSGELTQVKGASPVPAFALTAAPPSEGYVVLTAASATEDAQESANLEGSFFTHFLVSGLLGAANRDADAHVTLDEAYRYAYDATVLSSSRTLAGTQHPTYRYDLRGKGELVLSSFANARLAMARFEEPLDFLVFDSEGEVVGEVAANAPNRTLVVPPGDLLVRARAADAVFEGHVTIEAEQTRLVQTSELTRMPYTRVVRKGLVASDRTLAFAPSLAVGLGATFSGSPVGVAELRVPVAFASFTTGADLLVTTDPVAFEQSVSLTALIENTWDLALVSIGTHSVAGVVMQRGRLASIGLGPTFGLGVGVDVPLYATLFARVQCDGRVGLTFPIAGASSNAILMPYCGAGLGGEL